ncbi:hypothetical protein BCR34DRAFT_388212 [Clohesyomyces aquaticus]|uniref:Uncharacterized protein n=1 Tax=Clohesyomyces aquaticus TaxID=1231657 RepID=A0A1Y1ZEV4_9PLEO|nr:hypothetical protein BCR34DRAFT_388212 [Clohesyomyces aquaticus]
MRMQSRKSRSIRITRDLDAASLSTSSSDIFMNESHYMFVYWVLGAFFDDIETLTLAVGLLRSFESVGSCLPFGIGAIKVRPMVNLIVAFVMFVVAVPSTFAATFLVPERPIDERELERDEISLRDESGHSSKLVLVPRGLPRDRR